MLSANCLYERKFVSLLLCNARKVVEQLLPKLLLIRLSLHHIHLIAFLIPLGLLSGCIKQTSLEKVQQEGVLHIVTRNAPAIYYEDKDGPAGLEYDLAKLFAEELGVELRVRVADDQQEIERILDGGFTNFAAAGIASTRHQNEKYKQSPFHSESPLLVIYKVGTYRPRDIEDLLGKKIEVPSTWAHRDVLVDLQQVNPALTWAESSDTDTFELLRKVVENEIDYTVIDAATLALHQAYYPRAQIAFTLTEPLKFGWQFGSHEDGTLADKSVLFFERIKSDGTLDHLYERYYGHIGQLNYVDARTFKHHIGTRLPSFISLFEEAAEEERLDWRLLAAIGYQESHWRPHAKSPTGVRGLMMLTQATAQDMNVADRLDPESSIRGGARYFKKTHSRIPERIHEPDRTWFALAAYNVGLGHLEDARVLTERDGKDPDKWADVMNYLPLLQQKKWYSQTKHGYARGEEPVHYVQNIRRYFDVLTFTSEQALAQEMAKQQVKEESKLTTSSLDGKQTAELTLPDPLKTLPPAL